MERWLMSDCRCSGGAMQVVRATAASLMMIFAACQSRGTPMDAVELKVAAFFAAGGSLQNGLLAPTV